MSSNRQLAGESNGTVAPHVLREYALLADGERGALIGPHGEIAWLCAPHWDSDAVLSGLLGGPGTYAVCPVEPFVWGGYYESGSLVWHSRWVTASSIIECCEALAFPAEPHRLLLLRQVRAVQGQARVRVALDLRGGFGKVALTRLACDGDGRWSGCLGELRVRWSGCPQAQVIDHGGGAALVAELQVDAGGVYDLALEIDRYELGDPAHAEWQWAATRAAWSAATGRISDGYALRETQHSAAVLTGLTSSSGALVAAATTSLPERAERGRNYDYRYAWLRDQCYAGQAAAQTGQHRLLDAAVRFVGGRLLAAGPDTAPAYTVTGDLVPPERRVGLPGYPGGTDVVGNHAGGQFQLDVFGEALMLLASAARADRLDADGWRAAEVAVAAVGQRWDEPDAGVWELEERWWTHSRLTCVAGLRAFAATATAATATRPRAPGSAADALVLADRITAEVSRRCLHPSGRWQRAADDRRIDAALLVAALRGAIPVDDPRSVATLNAVRAELTADGYVYRYRPDPRPLGDAEGAFLLCGYWLALAEAMAGHRLDAVRRFERMVAACGPPALYSEEFDVGQRQLRGNLPQAFVHALALESAVRLKQLCE